MKALRNEQLCVLAQKGDTSARDLLLEKNRGFICQTANSIYQGMSLEESDLTVDEDDLIQEGSLGLLNAIGGYDPEKKIKFLTYAAPAIKNAMIDFVRSEQATFEHRMTAHKKENGENGDGLQQINLDEVLPGEERLLRIEAIANPYVKTPEQISIEAETMRELYAALDKLTPREQAYLLYRFGFTDDTEHPLIGAAIHFHLQESRAKKLEGEAMDELWLELPWWF